MALRLAQIVFELLANARATVRIVFAYWEVVKGCDPD